MAGLARRHSPTPVPLPGRAGPRPSARRIVSRGVEGDMHRHGAAEMAARAQGAAAALSAAGLAPGDAVATLAWNGHRHVEIGLAACAAGLRLLPLDPQDHPDRIVHAIAEAGVRSLCFDLSFMPLVEEIASRLAGLRSFVALTDPANMPGPVAGLALHCYETLLERAPPWPGGAEGCPPAVAPSRDPAPGAAPAGLAFRPDDAVLLAVPLSRPQGRALARAVWQAGGGLLLPGPWLDACSLHRLLAGEGATVAAAPAQAWRGLLAHVERQGASLAGLRLAALHGDAAASAPVARALRDRHGLEVLCLPPPPPSTGGGTRRTPPR